LWQHRRSGDGGLVTAKRLHEYLKGEEHPGILQGLKLRSVKKALARLESAGFVESMPVAKEEGQPGPPPDGYRLPEDGKIISWRSTARIVMELFHHPHAPVEEGRFISEIMQLGLCRDDSDELATNDDVADQIVYCIRKEYIRVDESGDAPGGKAGERRLCRTPRIDTERNFLELIAVPRRLATKKLDTPSSAAGLGD
jgi:hypothetical protein